jgi:hypothetical protein
MSTTQPTAAGLSVKLIGTCEAARILGVHRNTVGHWAQNGILRARVLPTGARRFDPGEVQRVRAQIHPPSPDDAPPDPVLLAGTTGPGKAAMLWSCVPADTERQVLHRITRGLLIGEGELRYQLERKDHHPLARAPGLLDVLAELEQQGLVEAELCFRLTPEGRECLAQDAGRGGDW